MEDVLRLYYACPVIRSVDLRVGFDVLLGRLFSVYVDTIEVPKLIHYMVVKWLHSLLILILIAGFFW